MKFCLIKALIGNKNHTKTINFKDYLPEMTLKTGNLSLEDFSQTLKEIVPEVPSYIIPEFFMSNFHMK